MSKENKANPAGRLGVAGSALSYAEKKELNHGITLRQIEEEQTEALWKVIEIHPKRDTRFDCIRSLDDLRREVLCDDC